MSAMLGGASNRDSLPRMGRPLVRRAPDSTHENDGLTGSTSAARSSPSCQSRTSSRSTTHTAHPYASPVVCRRAAGNVDRRSEATTRRGPRYDVRHVLTSMPFSPDAISSAHGCWIEMHFMIPFYDADEFSSAEKGTLEMPVVSGGTA